MRTSTIEARLAPWLVVGVIVGALSATGTSRARSQPTELVEAGRELYVASCLSCHGEQGAGTAFGPPLDDVGAAAVDFQLRTGRMPLADPAEQTRRKPPAFGDDEIDALVAYVAGFGPGPDIPDVDALRGDLSQGQELFVANCAPCHGATANGGAAGEDALAPSLYVAEPLDIAEAIITGPGEMPVFDFTSEQIDSIVRFVGHLEATRPVGGADIGGVGPVPEGFVAWSVGMTALVVVALFVARSPRSSLSDEDVER